MKITFLGTSAGESYPAVWCDCENCTYARAHGGRNLRMNTGTMIDSDTLLDMNSCGFYTAARLGVSLTGVRNLLVTHPHPDHLTIEPLAWRQEAAGAADASPEAQRAMISPRFTHLPMLTVYGNRFVREALVGARPELFDGSVPAQMRFQEIREEFGSFSDYIWGFTEGKTYLYTGHQKGQVPARNGLSDRISKDLKKRGLKYMGSVTVYSHLQACGIINDHMGSCFRFDELLEVTDAVHKRRDHE